ncbi:MULTISPECIES: class I SAM-dependent methyltransferase [unclassified Mesorhizobium]|uniref:class I SAM-dependent methyltransferase n=1 Tax=unclassified Mesorhizobium TaxID=325217 RepID=UPI00096442BA|nr:MULTISPECIES: class I SAM-dependent methyltransferase [unclassified Mesorhizobium]MBN9257601.1 methyltransferase type 11 [Mesorhizobium sp.]MBN9271393.1 methyltransferase type 11 [Mesorhizobium sp.]OJX83019.1 MAG: methyltransferase type 11 [Mesorhizobium sp. 65-26]
MTDHWNAIRHHWQLLGPPLRPPPEAVEAYERELGLRHADVLLLGVTPELAGLGATMLAVDESANMIAGIWPGDTLTHKATAGNWLDLPVDPGGAEAVIGDGCLSVMPSSEARLTLFRAIARVLKPEARAAIRLFASPAKPESPEAVRALALSGAIATFHELKWRVAMVETGGAPDFAIPVKTIVERFNALFPDRVELSERTGWALPVIGTIDVYESSRAIYSFAPAAVVADEAACVFDDVAVASSGSYGLAERCPLLVFGSRSRG